MLVWVGTGIFVARQRRECIRIPYLTGVVLCVLDHSIKGVSYWGFTVMGSPHPDCICLEAPKSV